MRKIKSPLIAEEGHLVHRRAMFGHTTVCEHGYFTRYVTGKAKPEVLR